MVNKLWNPATDDFVRVSCPVPSNKSQGPPGTFDAMGSASVPIAEGTTDWGARGWSFESHVTSVTGVKDNHKFMYLKVFYLLHRFG